MNPVDILKKHKLKRTSCREGIIEVMANSPKALSESDIREKLGGNYDRTTFYRSFKTLEEHNILHKIVIDQQFVKYALDNAASQKEEHAHFYCNQCQTVKCLEDMPVIKYKLPDDYINTETEVLIKGVCSGCQKTDD